MKIPPHPSNQGKITVNSIVHTAGVSPSTWFRNFSSKKEAISFKLTILWDQWAAEHHLSEKHHYYKNIDSFFQFFYHYRELHMLLYKTGFFSPVFDLFYQFLVPSHDANPFFYYQNVFFCYGLYGIVLKWVENGLQESPQKMTVLFYKCLYEKLPSPDSAPADTMSESSFGFPEK